MDLRKLFQEDWENIVKELDKASGEAKGQDGAILPPNFEGWKVPEDLKFNLRAALNAFEQGSFVEATKKLEVVKTGVKATQLAYARKICLQDLKRQITGLEVEKDLLNAPNKALREFEALILTGNSFVTIDEASKSFWAVKASIGKAKEEQKARQANRLRKKQAEDARRKKILEEDVRKQQENAEKKRQEAERKKQEALRLQKEEAQKQAALKAAALKQEATALASTANKYL